MSDWIPLCSADAIPLAASRGFQVETAQGPLELLLVNDGGVYRAYRNSCPHTGVGLNWQPDQFLDVENRFIQCAVHGALFRLRDGHCLRGPCLGQSLQPLPLGERDGRLWLAMAPPEAV